MCSTAGSRGVDENNEDYPSKEVRSNNNVLNLALPRKRVPKDEKKSDGTDPIHKRRRKFCSYLEEATNLSSNGSAVRDDQEPKENKVRSMATQLLAKFESTPSSTIRKTQPFPLQTLELAESLHIKLRPPVPPKPPSEMQFEVSIRKAAEHLVRLPPKTLPKPQLGPEVQHPFSVVKLRHVDQTHADTKPQPHPESADPPASSPSCHSAIHFMSRVLQRLREVDAHVSEKKAQTQQAREFHTKSIKEKAVHLRGLFSADSSAVLKGGSLRRAFPQSGDQCHSCERRVYMVERVCAEGLYFHRECFRCSTCSSALRQGAHAFDSEQGKLYCKLHFDQRNSGTNLRRTFSVRSNRSGAGVQERCADDGQTSESSSTADLQSQPSAAEAFYEVSEPAGWLGEITF
ncbi:hypothetical protein PFLUV_G00032200 [Perca fluviatilis]|uniref:LIM zinc-binding domain-containing protein n=1 Tax=Perca fluviatilis TaxID=8168 RepID=A0A6A5FIC1_PERFL|nr:hypothetical protein PFLUV_G00032200 [Perca fluviatilis]